MTSDQYRAAGGSAHPTGPEHTENGATLRDLFAAHALGGLLAFNNGDPDGCEQFDPETAAAEAFSMADAMLRERAKSAKA